MNAKQLNKIFTRAMYGMVIVAMVLSVTGVVYAQDEPLPTPYIRAHPVEDSVDAWFWPENVTLHLVIDDPNTEESPDLEMDMSGTVDPNVGSVWFYFADTYDLKPGDLVTMSDGVTTRSLIVSSLSIDEVDVETDTVSGTVEPETQVRLPSPDNELFVTSDSDGLWFADFTQIGFDLTPGTMVIAEVFDEDGDNSSFEQWIPNPWFSAFPEGDFVEGWDWPMDADIHMTIEDLGTEDSPDFEMNGKMVPTPWDPESGATWVWFEFPDDYDMKPGDVVTLTDGITERTHVVQSLDITEINLDENQVYGTADGEKNVILWSWEDPEGRRIETTSDGNWGVDFDDIGFTLEPGYHVRAEVWIDGNDTAVDRYITIPRFTVFPEWEWFDGIDWPDGSTVFISVEGKDDCSTEGTSWDYFFNGGFPEGCDVEIGDTVTFTDGETVRTHIVQNLAVTKANHDEDTIKGIADPGAEVYVWPHATGEQLMATTKTKGDWHVDFSGIYDLTPGECGRSEIRDEFANSTAMDWCISNPRIVASESGDWFWTTEFKPGDLDIYIYDSADEGANLLWSGQQVADESGFAFVGFDIHSQDLLPGNYLIVSDGDSQKDLILQPISITMFDPQYEIMAGFAPPGSDVWAAAGPQEWQEQVMVQADSVTGEWLADFKTIGFDITEEMRPWSYASVYDGDGDANEGSTPPPLPNLIVIANQADWVDSGFTVSAGQSFTIEASGLMNPCSDTYPNGSEICIFYTPVGGEWAVPYENEFGIFPGPGLPFMTLLGRIGDGEPFYVGVGGTFIAEQDGTLWFTPNDNLRTDNQGAYGVLVWLE